MSQTEKVARKTNDGINTTLRGYFSLSLCVCD